MFNIKIFFIMALFLLLFNDTVSSYSYVNYKYNYLSAANSKDDFIYFDKDEYRDYKRWLKAKDNSWRRSHPEQYDENGYYIYEGEVSESDIRRQYMLERDKKNFENNAPWISLLVGILIILIFIFKRNRKNK